MQTNTLNSLLTATANKQLKYVRQHKMKRFVFMVYGKGTQVSCLPDEVCFKAVLSTVN